MGVKKTAFYLVVSAIFLHFFLLGINHIPYGILHPKVHFIASYYVNPQFLNDFTAFAPEPPTGREFFVYRGKLKNDRWTPWYEDATDLLQQSRENLFGYHYKKWKIQNMLGFDLYRWRNNLWNDKDLLELDSIERVNKVNDRLVQFPHYKMAISYASTGLQDRLPNMEFDTIEIGYIYDYVDSNRNDYKLKFPSKALNQ